MSKVTAGRPCPGVNEVSGGVDEETGAGVGAGNGVSVGGPELSQAASTVSSRASIATAGTFRGFLITLLFMIQKGA
jgi:hypothetical protein